MWNKWLFKQVDNSGLVFFRIAFGLLIALEAFGGIFTGWVRRTLVEPNFTFNFIGFEFLQPLPGDLMYYYYGLMGVFGLLVMIGFKYRFSMACYTIMWASVYLMQKSSYNNHYYLLMLLCFIMVFLPAHRALSYDAWKNKAIRSLSMPRWVWLFIVIQLFIVYTFASVAKLYPDWLDATVPEMLMRGKKDFWLVGEFLQRDWIKWVIAYFGLVFDLLIVPMLLWKRTRLPFFILAVFFHLFNSFIFHIGIFPYLSLAFCVFFFPTEQVNKYLLRNKKAHYDGDEVIVPQQKGLLKLAIIVWFVVQISLPLRHWFIKDNVLWTEEGHRLSWRMMLRTKSGRATFKVVEKGTTDTIFVKKQDYLSRKQRRAINSKPDMIWQFSQRLKDEYAAQGKDVQVFVNARVAVNGRSYERLIDPKVDIANEEWNHFGHHDWILPSNLDK
ncbi:HTTM domain-containing protein [Zunongwangia endophytica]|uniref:HTTM domain-containing protein n=1 Tax=Zunongwangia endophytica TaxID=1808945 RepID=A0ABV8H3A1_9FLAO|nr:HTTM domain-containing protein [Zunongwangia endophytica]MDN3596159.1 HTTM domain-containing protein [Zunongwangia endophytica]